MKHFTLIVTAALILTLGLVGMSFRTTGKGGTHFMEWKWSDVEQQAKLRNKPIFIFVGASYCNISARMVNIFRKKEVGEVLNENFVCNRMNTDDGIMNNMRASNWGVSSVPSYLFFTANGKLVFKSEGFKDKDNMLADIQTAMGKIKETK